jgi:hypothetical protein
MLCPVLLKEADGPEGKNKMYNITDIRLCQLLRPIKNKPQKKITFYGKEFTDKKKNWILYISGQWSARMHMILDFIVDYRKTEFAFKELRNRYPYLKKKYFNYTIKNIIEEIAQFKFRGVHYYLNMDKPVFDIIEIDKKRVSLSMNMKPKKMIRIPHSLYDLNDNAQFIYRKFFAHLPKNKDGNYHYKSFENYLGLDDKRHGSKNKIDGYLNELETNCFIKIQNTTRFPYINILKLL